MIWHLGIVSKSFENTIPDYFDTLNNFVSGKIKNSLELPTLELYMRWLVPLKLTLVTVQYVAINNHKPSVHVATTTHL
jgi:hypothetical protein